MATIRARLAGLVRGSRSGEDAEELLRELHTMKGEARVVGLDEIGHALHTIEELLAGRDLASSSAASSLSTLEAHLDALEHELTSAQHGPRAGPSLPSAPPAAEPLLDHLARGAGEAFLRVDVAALALVARATGELRVGEADLTRLVEDLAALAEQVRAAERAREVVSGRTLIDLRRLVVRARQVAFDQHMRLDRLTEHVRDVRMVELASLFEPFPRAARQLATDLGKDVEVRVLGANVEVDRQVLDAITEPLLHLVRNAIDHGLELPHERRSIGKSSTGILEISARVAGSLVTIDVRDDGPGIDLTALCAAVAARGDAEVHPATLDDEAILDLLCRQGLSTRTEASSVSGRGVGLDVVKRRVEAVGGRLRLRTVIGAGSTFSLDVPMSALLATMLCALADGARYAFTPHDVERITELRVAAIEHVGGGLVLRVEGKPVPLFDLTALLGAGDRDPRARTTALVVVHAGRRLALALDAVTGTLPVLQQRLDPFLEGASVVRSVALFANGELAVALDVSELFRRAEGSVGAAVGAAVTRAEGPRGARTTASRVSRVLVVDDSELTRDVVVSILREMGLDVVEAVDGSAALEIVAATPPDLVMTDLDMPIVDGFELLRRLRAAPASATLPVVVLSSRGSPDDIQRASQLGADGYLIKHRLDPAELRRVVGAHLVRPA